jgi:hypothetical protein
MTYELQPFNQTRFDACMAWVAKAFDRTLSQYEAVKIHALADALHVVRFHNPIIGGTLKKLPYGAVALNALNRAKRWKIDKDAPFEMTDKNGNAMYFKRKPGSTREAMFTPAERQTILEAAGTVFSMTFAASQKFFHGESGENNFLGKAWSNTHKANAPISWDAILTAYAAQTGADVAALKSLICT